MKEAIGTTFVFNLIMVFVGVMIALFVGALSYSKGFKIRNRIIDIIQKQEGYTEQAQIEIDQNLGDIGYRIIDKECGDHRGTPAMSVSSPYRYCMYEYNTTKGKYYGVKVFIHFDIPLLGDWFEIPLYGETRILFDKSEVKG